MILPEIGEDYFVVVEHTHLHEAVHRGTGKHGNLIVVVGPAERFHPPGNLGVWHEGGQPGFDISCEGSDELGLVQEEIPVVRRQDRWDRRAGRRILDQAGDRLAPVRAKAAM